MLFRNNRSPFFWAILAGAFGLSFGALCSIPYLFIGGVPMAVTSFISGIPFDVVHCVSNYIITLVLFKPLYHLLNWMNQKDIGSISK
jgi:energy-coupling factor transport system substrate-specific component